MDEEYSRFDAIIRLIGAIFVGVCVVVAFAIFLLIIAGALNMAFGGVVAVIGTVIFAVCIWGAYKFLRE